MRSQRIGCDARCCGSSLIVALILMVAMSVAALSLARMVSADLRLAGHAAFREAAVLASDAGTEAALRWLNAQASVSALANDLPAQGYYASVAAGLQLTDVTTGVANAGGTTAGGPGTDATPSVGIDWDDDGCAALGVQRCIAAAPALPMDGAGHRIRYTIHRLCSQAGATQGGGNHCLSYQPAQGGAGSRGQLGYGAALRLQPGDRVYYRVTTRVRGPRNTTVFTQVLVHL